MRERQHAVHELDLRVVHVMVGVEGARIVAALWRAVRMGWLAWMVLAKMVLGEAHSRYRD